MVPILELSKNNLHTDKASCQFLDDAENSSANSAIHVYKLKTGAITKVSLVNVRNNL